MAALVDAHWESVTPGLRALLRHIGRQPFATRFYLGGGTALTLRLGHRRSIDLDFFSEQDDVTEDTRRVILDSLRPFGAGTVQAVEAVDGNLVAMLPELHVAFLHYGYPLVEPPDVVENVAVASLVDVGLMKLDALISRASRKDFYDLYWVLQHTSLTRLLGLGQAKYPDARDFEVMAVESLVYFDNADRDLQPELLVDIPWPAVRDYFLSQARGLGEAWLSGDQA